MTIKKLCLRKILDEIVHPDQTHFVPGHTIQDTSDSKANLICERKKFAGPTISLDQSKAFDRLSHEYLFKLLHGFGPQFIKLLNNDIYSSVLVNGFVSYRIRNFR